MSLSVAIVLSFALGGGSLLVWMAVLGFAMFLTDWLPRQVVVSRAGDRMVPAQIAIAANLLVPIWLALFFLTSQMLRWKAAPPDKDWLFVSSDVVEALMFVFMSPILMVLAPVLTAVVVMPLVGSLLHPVEWLVSRCSMDEQQRPATVAAVLALLSGSLLGLTVLLVPLLDSSQSSSYLSMQCWLAPFGLLSWLFARLITSQGLS